MTSDATQTERVARERERVRPLVARARVVLWDFDGPICRLFAGHKAHQVAEDLIEWLGAQGLRGLLTPEEQRTADPHVVLHAVDRMHPRSDLVAALEERLTEAELTAAASAWPTPYADPLIRTLVATGVRLAIATNNSPRTARAYLSGRNLEACFAPHVYGRTTNLALLKPHPYCLDRALTATGATREATLMIGDTPSDLIAARRAGIGFLGYARDERKRKLLHEAGAGAGDVVTSLESVLQVARDRP
ncbi:HAD family hydrolase [Streptomyces poriticola]|uniref:HAD family hydrolase n=1 Tax=Streptomyces poriticola TaxID=3120506 RepID=UPI002FCE254A